MKLSIVIIAFVLLESSLFTATAAGVASQALPSTNEFPRVVELIPGKLKAKIFLHDIKNGDQVIHCWSLLSDGLLAHKQKEIIFTVQRDSTDNATNYPQEFLDLLRVIYQFAEQGKLVDVGDLSTFSQAGVPGHKDFRGLGYVQPEVFSGVDTHDVPLLAAIMLKGDEAAVAHKYGVTRVTALLGAKYRYYPCPPWWDLKREPVASLAAMDKSPLASVPRMGIHGSYYEESNRIILSLPSSARTHVQQLSQAPLSAAVVFLTQPDPRADACLVWRPTGEAPSAITPPNSSGSRKTGSFLVFLPQQKATEFRIVEDGFAIFLTDKNWQKLRQGLISGSDTSVSASSKPGSPTFWVRWEEEFYSRSAHDDVYRMGHVYYPDASSASAPKPRVAITSTQVVLLTSDKDIKARTTVKDLADYVNSLADAIDVFFTPPERKASRDLTVQIILYPAGAHAIRIGTNPALPQEVFSDLEKRVGDLPSPQVSGIVQFDYNVSVWKTQP